MALFEFFSIVHNKTALVITIARNCVQCMLDVILYLCQCAIIRAYFEIALYCFCLACAISTCFFAADISVSLLATFASALISFFFVSYPSSCATILFFFNDTATTEIYTLSLHDALPI